MNLSDIKLIVTDMDGTLLNSAGNISDTFYPLFDKVKSQNILFAVASGRQYYSLIEKLGAIKDQLIFIAENGAIVMENGDQIFIQPMEKEMAHSIINRVKEIGGKYLILCGKESAYIESTDPEFMDPFLKHYEKYEVVDDLRKVTDDEFLKVTVCDLSGAEENTYPYVKDLKEHFQVKLSGKIWVDFTHKDAHKGNALQNIQKAKSISAANTISFGDYLNDIELFEHSGYSFAMANAHEDVKKAAKEITASNDDNGVEKVLADLLKNVEVS